MKIHITQSELNAALQVAQKAVSARSILPVLTGVLFRADGDMLELYATDLEISLRCRVPAQVEEDGVAVIPARLLGDIVRNLPDERVTLAYGEKSGMVKLSCASSAFDLKGFSAEDFPKFPELQKETGITLAGKDFSSIVKQVIRAVSKDETRPVLSGVLMIIESGHLTMVSTDSYRLAIREANVEGASVEDVKVIVPARCLDEVAKIGSDEEVEIGLAKNQIYFKVAGVVFVSRLIEGQFPPYQQLLPSDCDLRVKFIKDDLVSSLRRLSLLAQNNALVKMKVDGDTVQMSAETQDVGNAVEILHTETQGDGMEVAFNAQFLIDGLSSIGEDTVVLELNSPLKPGLLRPAVEQNFIYLVMPVRIG